MNAIDALATTAFCLLDYRGQSRDPTLHQIAWAATQSSTLFDAGNVGLIDAAVCQLIERHPWQDKTVVIFDPPHSRRRSRA